MYAQSLGTTCPSSTVHVRVWETFLDGCTEQGDSCGLSPPLESQLCGVYVRHVGSPTPSKIGDVELYSAGEADRPHRAVPRAVRATFLRIALFYVLTILVIGLCINWADPTLLSSADGTSPPTLATHHPQSSHYHADSDVVASPVTVVFVRAGFGAAAHVVNAVLLTAVLSATNSCFYASSRMMLSLARTGHAPKILGRVNSRGVPVYALLYASRVPANMPLY